MIDDIFFLLDSLYDSGLDEFQIEILYEIKSKLSRLHCANEVATFVDTVDYKILTNNLSSVFAKIDEEYDK